MGLMAVGCTIPPSIGETLQAMRTPLSPAGSTRTCLFDFGYRALGGCRYRAQGWLEVSYIYIYIDHPDSTAFRRS